MEFKNKDKKISLTKNKDDNEGLLKPVLSPLTFLAVAFTICMMLLSGMLSYMSYQKSEQIVLLSDYCVTAVYIDDDSEHSAFRFNYRQPFNKQRSKREIISALAERSPIKFNPNNVTAINIESGLCTSPIGRVDIKAERYEYNTPY